IISRPQYATKPAKAGRFGRVLGARDDAAMDQLKTPLQTDARRGSRSWITWLILSRLHLAR
ncbi:hypothetical protein, partial [Mesorhizobium sp. M7A.T.Ca.TU.009.02.1.1]|uniref:hypothetical protein n=1 Tax=Mesorhizobium sp. M7A.T.Ca.TU.009.02.1.1 TaxID=2496791 RepID=UPI0019CFB43D